MVCHEGAISASPVLIGGSRRPQADLFKVRVRSIVHVGLRSDSGHCRTARECPVYARSSTSTRGAKAKMQFQRRWAASSGRPDRERAVAFRCRLTRTGHRSDSVTVSEVKRNAQRGNARDIWRKCAFALKSSVIWGRGHPATGF